MKKELTIFTDSSMYRKLGSWSVLLKTDNDSVVISGLCPEYIQTAVQGEIYAIIKAFDLAKKLYPKYKKLTIFTDCIGLCFSLKKGGKPQRHPINRMLQKCVLHKAMFSRIEYEIVHVKGHNYKDIDSCEKSFYNDIVDTHARQIRHKTQISLNYKKRETTFFTWLMATILPYTAIGQEFVFNALEYSHKQHSSIEKSQVSF